MIWVNLRVMDALSNFLAETLDPFFVVLLLCAPLIGPRSYPARVLPFYLASALGIAIGIVLAEEGKQHMIWSGHPGFPSGHETSALSCATSLVCWRIGWIWAVMPLVLVMGWALVTARYHITSDVWGALLSGLPPTLLCHAWRLRRQRKVT